MSGYDRHIPYNDLPLLPPADELIYDKTVFAYLCTANRLLGEMNGISKRLTNPSMLVNTIALREAKASTAIENIFTTDDELYKALSVDETLASPAVKEVLHYREALWEGYDSLKKNGNLWNTDVIISIYRKIKQISDGIRPAQSETVIMKRGTGSLKGEVVYTPPRGEEVILNKLDNLFEFINDDIKYPMDPVLKMCLAHYQFEAIHPFRDGNGRTGRILCILILTQKKIIDVPILYLSSYIIRQKNDYYYSIGRVTALRKWNEWIKYMLKAVQETASYTIELITGIEKQYASTGAAIRTSFPKMPQAVASLIFEQPYISPKRLLATGIKSINTAKKYLEQLHSIGIMIPEKVGKEIIYLNADLFNILSE